MTSFAGALQAPGNQAELTGFNAKRIEFEPDYDPHAEALVAELEFKEDDTAVGGCRSHILQHLLKRITLLMNTISLSISATDISMCLYCVHIVWDTAGTVTLLRHRLSHITCPVPASSSSTPRSHPVAMRVQWTCKSWEC